MVDGYGFHPMSDAEAREVAGWRYDPPFDFYDGDADPDDLAEILDAERREGAYFSAWSGDELVGFFQFEEMDGVVDVGLGMRPDKTGKGFGVGFLFSGLEFARRRFAPVRFTLAVAAFNGRAIRVYERAGFRRGEGFSHETNGGQHEFLAMWREA